MIKSLLTYCGALLVVLFLIGSAHYFVIDFFFPNKFDIQTIPKAYFLWSILSILGFAPVFWFEKKNPSNSGMVYLVTSILKMFGALTIMLPILLEPNEENTFFSLNFVVVFFIILLFELVYFIRIQNNIKKAVS